MVDTTLFQLKTMKPAALFFEKFTCNSGRTKSRDRIEMAHLEEQPMLSMRVFKPSRKLFRDIQPGETVDI